MKPLSILWKQPEDYQHMYEGFPSSVVEELDKALPLMENYDGSSVFKFDSSRAWEDDLQSKSTIPQVVDEDDIAEEEELQRFQQELRERRKRKREENRAAQNAKEGKTGN